MNENLSEATTGSARVLDNWFPTTQGARVRGGAGRYATLPSEVKSMFSYTVAGGEKFFAATSSEIYDITSPADPLVSPAAVSSGKASGLWHDQQFGTAGGNFLYLVNGADNALLYDGATWTEIDSASSPAITGENTSDLSFVWSYASRLFFIKKDSLEVKYLPVDSIGGALSTFSLAGIFKLGGSLSFGATWSLDAGDGLDDKCVFVSTEGEVAIYEGIDPSDAANWRKVGVYNMARPLGAKAIMETGGDLFIATEEGLIPLTHAINRPNTTLSLSAMSYPIEPHWKERAKSLTGKPWEIIVSPLDSMLCVSQPTVASAESEMLVANTRTGAWARFTGWNSNSLGYFAGLRYFGDLNGAIRRMEIGGSDDGTPYTATYVGQFESFGAKGLTKTVTQMMPVMQSAHPVDVKVSVRTDYNDTPSPVPPSIPDFDLGSWDNAVWDEGVWDAGISLTKSLRWQSIGRTGKTIAPEVQITFGVTPTPKVEIIEIDASYHIGSLVT